MLLCLVVAWWPARTTAEEPLERSYEGGNVPFVEEASDDVVDVLDVLPIECKQHVLLLLPRVGKGEKAVRAASPWQV